MPRRNKRKMMVSEPHRYTPSLFNNGYKQYSGCAFVGMGSAGLTTDSKCLKVPPSRSREVCDAEINRRTNTAS